jgi:radical SAM superfamily enzyme YgiQ (UPF0313 family)
MRIAFISTRKNLDRSERELYEMDLILRVTRLKRAFADLGLLTIAACTPEHVECLYIDEYCEEIDYGMEVDAVALSAKTSCVTRAYQVADEFRRRGVTVILGGIHASLRPDEALEHADCIVTGEAEALWPGVVADLEAGTLLERYDASEFPPMDEIPPPAWDIGGTRDLLFQQLQTTRGCPFRCRFCSVPSISGQSFRFKPVGRVMDELEDFPAVSTLLARTRPLYIVDDNFLSRKRYTKELLEAFIPLYRSGQLPHWSAETTLNVASDPELLDLFRDAGCNTLIIGLESISQATLDDMDKAINYCLTYQEGLQRIHDRGMSVVGNFIVGFDTDTRDVFRQTRDFIQETGILFPFFSILNPMPGTALFDETKAAGRLFHEDWQFYDTRHVVFEPAQMDRHQLMDGYIWLYEQCFSGDRVLARLEAQWKRQPPQAQGGGRAQSVALAALLAPEMMRGDRELRQLYRAGLKMLRNPHLNSNPGQLLSMLDSHDFARFMRRHRSPHYAENAASFERPLDGDSGAELQWRNERAQRRSQGAPRGA